jgi:hypothetical protein
VAPALAIEAEIVEQGGVETALSTAAADEPDLAAQQGFQIGGFRLGVAPPAQLGRAELCRQPQRLWDGAIETAFELSQRIERRGALAASGSRR